MKRLSVILMALALAWATLAIAANTSKKRPTTTGIAPQSQPAQQPVGGDDVARPPIDETRLIETTAPVEVEDLGDENTPLVLPATLPPHMQQQASPSQTESVAGGNPVNMDWYSINNGGAIEVAAGNIKMGLSIGQNAVGEVAAGNIKMGLGFWYGAGGSGACACQCHGNPDCSGGIDIVDVSLFINVALRFDPPGGIDDPLATCPYQTTDVDCNGITDIVDVSRAVNVAFRDALPVGYCTPCGLAL